MTSAPSTGKRSSVSARPETIQGIVRTITFRNEENGYTVAKIETPDGRTTAVTGSGIAFEEGETIQLSGAWVNDPKYGRQFRYVSWEPMVPPTEEGIRRFLASARIKGIGPVFAERIVAAFGADTVRVLDEEPERLREVKGISPKLTRSVRDGWERHRHHRDTLIFLQSHDITPGLAGKILSRYGDDTTSVLTTNPYRLIADIPGIGFIKADQIAARIGIHGDTPERVQAGVLYCLDTAADAGHVYAPLDGLVEKACAILDVPADSAAAAVESLRGQGRVVVEDLKVYHSELAACEVEVARLLHLLSKAPSRRPASSRKQLEESIAAIESESVLDLAPRQREAIVTAVESPVMALTGGPGTGKTTTVRSILALCRILKRSVLLSAPTGRAAKRLAETTGQEAKTIHRLLEYNPHTGRFTRNASQPLDADMVIVDESSMIDIVLMHDVLKAIRPTTGLILVGDADQLPSIGPGNVLKDIIASGSIPTVRLDRIFRQSGASDIVDVAHTINAGKPPRFDNANRKGGFFFKQLTDPAAVAATITDLVTRRLPASYGFDPIEDIQVLSPMHKSETGVARLNALLQERLTPFDPGHPEVRRGDWAFRIGDKVMQVRNNYDKLVFNGDIGRIAAIDPKRSELTVRFETDVVYGFGELDDLSPAYAISVHKSQGSEFRCVVMPITTQHYVMLRRNLVYTAVTRARELVVLIGDYKALAMAVRNDQVGDRCTALASRIQDRFARGGSGMAADPPVDDIRDE